ncbi:shikimate dehydrogenase family protein [Roseicyclus sp.]|uniref:shikimate dehydrogenase family protein n=1 Tax=Roseicyclus sp. TaxID=1914329 RepID=UPI003F9F67A1
MSAHITGTTRIVAHLGVPTEGFRSPMIYNPWFAARGIDAAVVPMGVEVEDFAAFLPLLFRLRNVAGALVTMPHKIAAAALVDRAGPAVRICGACNAVRRAPDGALEGEMFDGTGFLRAMEARGRGAAGASALIVGAGGVGSAIAAALAGAGAARIALRDTEPGKAEALSGRLGTHFPATRVETGAYDPAGFDIVVNATPLGMRPGDPLPIEPARIDPGAFVGEVVMGQAETPLLAAARAKGCLVQAGEDMLYEQIPAYLDFFGFPGATADELRAVSRLQP